MTNKRLITFNAGSSSVKIGIFEWVGTAARRIGNGTIDLRHRPLSFHLTLGTQSTDVPLRAADDGDVAPVLSECLDWLAHHFDLGSLAAAGHRVVHGGDHFAGPAWLDAPTITSLDALTELAPLHQQHSLRLIRALQTLLPHLPQTASFDTAFHRTQSELVRRFAIPRALHNQGLKRYGFHGLSYKYVSGTLSRLSPALAEGRVVIAHLGSGASLCALVGGRSQDSSMGFSTLDGIPMATRSGALDPGAVLHLLTVGGHSLADVETMLYHESGLLGVSGISADSRVLLQSEHPAAREALDLFALRIAGEVARLAATIGGLDTLVFTAGIGEHQPAIRAAVCDRLSWMGLRVEPAANTANALTISTRHSAITVLVIATDEEQIIADEALSLLQQEK
jgi:acetate kinase